MTSPMRTLTATPSLDPDGVDARALDADTQSVHGALSELVRVYQFRDRDRICCHDISVTQCYALERVVGQGPLTLNELAGHLYLDKSTTSRVADALQKKGYVERRSNPEDGRSLLLEATPSGRRLHHRIREEILAQERELLADFEPEVRKAMATLMGRLARAAAARVDTSGGACCTVGQAAHGDIG
jgi:MarR family transcriptional regulator, 2-MHQ and catechol-resistance regulon repressor